MTISDFAVRLSIREKNVAYECYGAPEDSRRLAGALCGFGAFRAAAEEGAKDLRDLLEACRTSSRVAKSDGDPDYWFYRCYEQSVEWGVNCLSAHMISLGMPPILSPSVKGIEEAASIAMEEGYPDAEA
jgi:hypothetical protein